MKKHIISALAAGLVLSGCGQLLDGSRGGLGNMIGLPSKAPPPEPVIADPTRDCDQWQHRYDAASSTLEIRFRDGSVHQYDGVPPGVYEGLKGAGPKCAYFDRNIRNVYQQRRIR